MTELAAVHIAAGCTTREVIANITAADVPQMYRGSLASFFFGGFVSAVNDARTFLYVSDTNCFPRPVELVRWPLGFLG